MANKKKNPALAPIARRPDCTPNDECCTVCGDDKMWVVIEGGWDCGYCGNQINLCQKCYYRFRRECIAMELDSGTAYDTPPPAG